jgi:hypothetical protein
MGDLPADEPLPAEIDAAMLQQAVNAAFEPAEAITAAFVVTWRGRLIDERYGGGTQLRARRWKVGRSSITATLFGSLVKQGL